MRNIKLVLAFDGTCYAGWQRQKGHPTIQGVLEEAIARVSRETITLHGAGRTDAGVHADGMVANFSARINIPLSGLVKVLNNTLPRDIRVLSAENVANDFQARYNARGKVYEYTFAMVEIMPPLLRLYAAHVPRPLDLAAIARCLPVLVGTHDFSSFEATGSRDSSNCGGRGAVRTIDTVRLQGPEGEAAVCRLTIAGDGFLRHMVRNIIGTLFDIGRGSIAAEALADIMAARDRSMAGATAPACGLNLKKVLYD
ncbi:tRNA pseudouridine(38-40) synthase TruA [Thiovibrio sp. JS02]